VCIDEAGRQDQASAVKNILSTDSCEIA